MRNKLTSLAVAGVIGVSGIVGAAVLTPAISYAATGDSSAVGSAFRHALAGPAGDGTGTQAKADKGASGPEQARPTRGPGRRGPDLATAAKTLGMTEQEVRTALRAGKTLADLAADKDVEQSVLVDALVAAAKARLAQAVEDGVLTQAQADEKAAGLQARITDSLDRPMPAKGHGGRGGRHGGPPRTGGTASPAPSTGGTA